MMAKGLTAPYEAGRRGAEWIKVKRANTLDLVVLALVIAAGLGGLLVALAGAVQRARRRNR